MSFAREKARMLRVLKASDAPPEIVSDFEDVCGYRTTESAEELLRSICARHGFTKPYERDDQYVIIRPYNIGQRHPKYQSDCASENPISEQAYRRGYSQGAGEILQKLKAGATVDQIEKHIKKIDEWRTQTIQFLHSSPGQTTPQELPERWLAI